MTAKNADDGWLMFSRWPPPARTEDIPTLVQRLAEGLLKEAKTSSEFTLDSEQYRIEQFAGAQSQGSFSIFQITNDGTNTLAALFLMSIDGRIWNGQFTGPPEAWKQALTMLKSSRRKG